MAAYNCKILVRAVNFNRFVTCNQSHHFKDKYKELRSTSLAVKLSLCDLTLC